MKTDEPIKFYLEKRKDKVTGKLKTTNVPILLFFSFNGKRLQYYTGHRVDSKYWDVASMKVKRGWDGYSEINADLGNMSSIVRMAFNSAKYGNIPMSIEYFKKELQQKNIAKFNKYTAANKKEGIDKKINFSSIFDEYLKESELTKGEGTIKGKRSGFNILNEFAFHHGLDLNFENINMDFYNAFLEYCFDVRRFNNNYTGSLIKRLKAFLNWAADRGYHSNFDFRKTSFKALREEPEILYLTWDELMVLKDFKFNSEKLSNVRDLFCFGCFTGMRFSDINSLTRENVYDDKINYRVVKTAESNTIPLNKYSREILKRHNDPKNLKCLPVISEQKSNEYLKILAQEAGLNRNVKITHFRGAKRTDVTRPLFEILTFHISKKTFMTNFLAKGGSLVTAMSITGNKDLKTARRYYKVVDSLKKEEMEKVFG